jgi:hypothetical protein
MSAKFFLVLQDNFRKFEERLAEERKTRLAQRKEQRKEERRSKRQKEKEEAEQRAKDEALKKGNICYYWSRMALTIGEY